jgi:Mg/Co/Ni transporter MgtE
LVSKIDISSFETDPVLDEIQKKIKETGLISLTAEEQSLVGLIPDRRLINNPGKSLAEVMSNEEIRAHLANQERKSPASRERDVNYLTLIGRWPIKASPES